MKKLVVLDMATFVLFLSTLVGTPVIPELASSLGASTSATAATLSSALMTVVLLQFFTGGLADRYGRRPVLSIAALAGGLASLGCALAPNWRWLLAMRILGGVADAISMPALLGLTAEIGEGRQGTIFGVLRSAQGVSFVLGPAIGGALSLFSLRMPFLADAVLSLVASILLGCLVPTQSTHPDEGPRWSQLGRLKALLADRRLYAFALFCSVNNIAFPVLSAFVPVKARQLGADPRQISLMVSLEAVCFSLASWLIGRASDRWGRRVFVVAAQPGVILACVGLALAPGWQALAICYALFGLAGGTTFLLGLVMAADVIPPADASRALGAFDAAVDLLIFCSPALAMLAHRQLGRTAPLFLVAGLPALLAWPMALRMGETKADRSAGSQVIE